MHRSGCPLGSLPVCKNIDCCIYRDLRLYFGLPANREPPAVPLADGIEAVRDFILAGSRFALSWSANVDESSSTELEELYYAMLANDQAVSEHVILPFATRHLTSPAFVPLIPPSAVFMTLLGAALEYSAPNESWQSELFTTLINLRLNVWSRWSSEQRFLFTVKELFDVPDSSSVIPPNAILEAIKRPTISQVSLGASLFRNAASEADPEHQKAALQHAGKFCKFYLQPPFPSSRPADQLFALLSVLFAGLGAKLQESGLLRLIMRIKKSVLLEDVWEQRVEKIPCDSIPVQPAIDTTLAVSLNLDSVKDCKEEQPAELVTPPVLTPVMAVPPPTQSSPLSSPRRQSNQVARVRVMPPMIDAKELAEQLSSKRESLGISVEKIEAKLQCGRVFRLDGKVPPAPLVETTELLTEGKTDSQEKLRPVKDQAVKPESPVAVQSAPTESQGIFPSKLSRLVSDAARAIDERREQRRKRGILMPWEEDTPNAPEPCNPPDPSGPSMSPTRLINKLTRTTPFPNPVKRPSSDLKYDLVVRSLIWRGIARTDAEKITRNFLKRHDKEVDAILMARSGKTKLNDSLLIAGGEVEEEKLFHRIGRLQALGTFLLPTVPMDKGQNKTRIPISRVIGLSNERTVR